MKHLQVEYRYLPANFLLVSGSKFYIKYWQGSLKKSLDESFVMALGEKVNGWKWRHWNWDRILQLTKRSSSKEVILFSFYMKLAAIAKKDKELIFRV